ncbi:hypothetical protein ACP179_23710 [Xenorhabdus stockiae]
MHREEGRLTPTHLDEPLPDARSLAAWDICWIKRGKNEPEQSVTFTGK